MKTGRSARLLIVFAVVAAMTAGLFLLPGCGEDKASMQTFAEGIVDVMDKLQSKPEVKEAGQQAAYAYMESGYTDLDSAAKVGESFEESVKNDKVALED